MEGLQYDLSSLVETGDTVNVSGLGTYRDSDGNTNKDVEFGSTTDVGYDNYHTMFQIRIIV